MDYNKEIDLLVKSFEQSVFTMDLNTFGDTASWDRYDPLIAISWTKRILKLIDDLRATSLGNKDIALLFPNTSELRAKAFFDLWMSKYAAAPKKDRLKIAHFYINLLNAICLEDPYALTRNIVQSDAEIRELLTKVKQATLTEAKKLGRLANACYHLGHAMYSDMCPSIVYDNFGPYDVSEQYGPHHIVAIKDFGNLRAPELWPESKNVPWMHCRVVNVYKDVRLTMDSCSHAVYTGNLITGLQHYALDIDGKPFLIDKLDSVSETLEELGVAVFQKIMQSSFEEKKKIFYTQRAYSYKRLYDYLKQDWRPTTDIFDEMKDRPVYSINWPEDRDTALTWFRSILDPRVEMVEGIPRL